MTSLLGGRASSEGRYAAAQQQQPQPQRYLTTDASADEGADLASSSSDSEPGQECLAFGPSEMSDASNSDLVEPGSRDLEAASAETSAVDVKASTASVVASRSSAVVRLYVLDNAKFVLIICVVLTHMLAPLEGSHTFSKLFERVRFSFMMPTFTFISGYCSSPDWSSPRRIDGFLKVVAIYFMAQLFWLVLSRYSWWGLWETTCWGAVIAGNGRRFTAANPDAGARWKLEDFGKPYFQLWYLFCLIFWRLALPFWWRLRFPLLIAWPAAAGFCAFKVYYTYTYASWMVNIDYAVAWFPLFLLGVVAKQRKVQLSDEWWSFAAGVAALVATSLLPVFVTVPGQFGNGGLWAYGTSDEHLPLRGAFVMFLERLAVPLAHSLAVWAFLHVMPRQELRVVTGAGERSVAVYIFHPLGGMLVSYLGVYGPGCDAAAAPFWAQPAIVLFAVASALFWSSPWLWHVVWPVCDPPVHWFVDKA